MNIFFRLAGALLRAALVMLLVATPAILLPAAADSRQVVALMALFLGALVLVEYVTDYPSLIEFRHAPPFNRMRFVALFLTVVALSLIARGQTQPTSLTMLLEVLGRIIGTALDFPFSPVRLVLVAVDDVATPAQIALLRTAAGISYLFSLVLLTVFVILIRVGHWPARNQPFNIWINLPTFDPTAGRDVAWRLERDARVNIALGFLLPFLIPAAVQALASNLAPSSLANPQVMIWVMTAWSFLPASLFMRGIAMGRVADLIRNQRRHLQTGTADEESTLAHA